MRQTVFFAMTNKPDRTAGHLLGDMTPHETIATTMWAEGKKHGGAAYLEELLVLGSSSCNNMSPPQLQHATPLN